jgi:Protein of unknown function (DUF3275)
LEIIMKVFEGSLKVESIQGRKGAFSVGVLTTDIGQFKIKDAALDQFEPGVYDGEFVIARIYTKGEPWRGGYFTSLMVDVAQDGYHIHDEKASTEVASPAPAEPDPADSLNECPTAQTRANAPASSEAMQPAQTESAPSTSTGAKPTDIRDYVRNVSGQYTQEAVEADGHAGVDAQSDAQANADAKLFGVEIYPRFKNREVVALDATVDRLLFRQQRDQLKANGYRFDVATQSWLPPGHSNP